MKQIPETIIKVKDTCATSEQRDWEAYRQSEEYQKGIEIARWMVDCFYEKGEIPSYDELLTHF